MNKYSKKTKSFLTLMGVIFAVFFLFCVAAIIPSKKILKNNESEEKHPSIRADIFENHAIGNQPNVDHLNKNRQLTETSGSGNSRNSTALVISSRSGGHEQNADTSNDSGKTLDGRFPSLAKHPDEFLKVFLPFIFNDHTSSKIVMEILRKAGGSAQAEVVGNEDTGRRLEVTLANEKALGFSKFKLVYQLSDGESLERLLYGRAPDSEKWKMEFNNMSKLIDEEFGNSAISRTQKSDFVTWRLKNQRIIWINSNYSGYGKRMILVGLEYDIH